MMDTNLCIGIRLGGWLVLKTSNGGETFAEIDYNSSPPTDSPILFSSSQKETSTVV
jgi:hypothetical protein